MTSFRIHSLMRGFGGFGACLAPGKLPYSIANGSTSFPFRYLSRIYVSFASIGWPSKTLVRVGLLGDGKFVFD